MEKSVLSFIKRHQLIYQGATVLVGVSGGPDSMALLHFLHNNKELWDIQVIAISLDHQLRGKDAQEDIEFVRVTCKEWGIPFVSDSSDVNAYRERTGLSTEVAARELRYQFFSEQMEKFQANLLALGHHGDDQIETMLMNLTRSASSSSFSGIPVRRNFSTGRIIRPLLCVTKKEIETYCEVNLIQPRIDMTNFDPTYTRNYFRKYILPLIKEKNSNIHTTIQYLSETRNEDEQFLQAKASELVTHTVYFDKKKSRSSFEIQSFKKYPRALQRRALHLILNYLYNDLPPSLSYMHEEIFFSLLDSNKGNSRIDFPAGLSIVKSYDKIEFIFNKDRDQSTDTFHETLPIPGTLELPNNRRVSVTLNRSDKEDQFTYGFYTGQVALPLHIRTRKPGDRMTWTGLNGSKKIKDIFIDEKIPIHKRNSWPILVDNNDEIIWLIGLKKGKLDESRMTGKWIEIKYA